MATKLDKAISKVRSKESGEEGLSSLAGTEKVNALVRKASTESLKARLASGEIETGAALLSLEEGDEVTVFVVREGTTRLDDLNKPGSQKDAINWYLVLLDPEDLSVGPLVTILGAAQIDRQLRPLVGAVAIIARGGDVRTVKGRIMTEYFVGGLTTSEAREAASPLRAKYHVTQ